MVLRKIAMNKIESNSCPKWSLHSPYRRYTRQIVRQMVISAKEINRKKGGVILSVRRKRSGYRVALESQTCRLGGKVQMKDCMLYV